MYRKYGGLDSTLGWTVGFARSAQLSALPAAARLLSRATSRASFFRLSSALLPHFRTPARRSTALGSTTSTQAGMAQSPADRYHQHHHPNKMFANRPWPLKLPIPALEDACTHYLRALEGLQDKDEHKVTERAVDNASRTRALEGVGEREEFVSGNL